MEKLNEVVCELVPITDEDIHDIFRGLSHPEVIKYYGVSYKTLEATQEQMQWYKSLQEHQTGIWWKIVNETNEFVGACGFNDRQDDKAEIGFWILPEYWKQGYAVKAVTFALHYATTVMGLTKVEALVDTENRACIRFMDKLGFKFVRTITGYEIKDERPIDLVYYLKVL